jgi:hypothetical protein
VLSFFHKFYFREFRRGQSSSQGYNSNSGLRTHRDVARSDSESSHQRNVTHPGRGPTTRQTSRVTFKEAFNFEQNNAKLDLDQVAKEYEEERLKKALEEQNKVLTLFDTNS